MNDQHRFQDLPDIPPMPHLVVSECFLFFVQVVYIKWPYNWTHTTCIGY
ncbi:hypothetical protein T05_9237 [Trichinella murrelli]|uniref:Uncharacterized protein n=1 Tax=Trichinella murrelli TaxID=144512 RepID=A0A0V0T150_9BILA|nr:hypothetical protein T05_9237 [Trichinella murrelli]